MESATDPAHGTVTDPRFAYILDDDQMAEGSTLGAPRCTVVLKPSGAIEKVYSPDAGFDFFGSVQVAYWDCRSRIGLGRRRGEFHIHPHRQDHVYELANGVHVHEQVFAYNYDGEDGTEIPPPAAYYRVHFVNQRDCEVRFDAYGFCELRGNTDKDVVATFDASLNGIVTYNRSAPDQTRLFALIGKLGGWETTDDRGQVVGRTWPGELTNSAAAKGADPVGTLGVTIELGPRGNYWLEFLCVLASGPMDALREERSRCPAGDVAARRTSDYYWKYLNRSVLRTPDRDVNQGVLWAKANMLRVQTHRPSGWCFSNDPTRSNNSVGRDTAWMTMGADYLRPGFAREALKAFFRLQEPNGKIVEYYDVRNEKWEDYGLNVNDNTPLIVLALRHHFLVTGDKAFLKECYPNAVRAMDYILSQRNGDGLIWCSAVGVSDWGIVGWRNIIPNYRISGASTEVNSECYAALVALSQMCEVLGERVSAKKYRSEADALRDAINTHLVNPANGLYYLTIDVDGTARSEVTVDLVFPILFGVAPPERAAQIIGALSDASFWTAAGIRTAPRDDLAYGATEGFGLLGGVWVAATYWYAFAASKFNPAFMAKALATSFRHFASDPRRNNTVPGQFSEWLHGEILVNQGMMLSPWDAPRYLWAAIEGAGGLELYGPGVRLSPALGNEWRWFTAVNVPFRRKAIAWIAVQMPDGLRVHTTSDLECSCDTARYQKDITDSASVADALATLVAFEAKDRTLVFVGNSEEQSLTTAATLTSLPEEEHTVRLFSTVWNEWHDLGKLKRRAILDGIPVTIDGGGFALVEISPP